MNRVCSCYGPGGPGWNYQCDQDCPIHGNQRAAPSVGAGVEQDLGKPEPSSDHVIVAIQKAFKESPWPADVWPETVDDAGRYMRSELGDVRTTAISGVLMRHGWQCAEKAIQDVLSEQRDNSPAAGVSSPNPSISEHAAGVESEHLREVAERIGRAYGDADWFRAYEILKCAFPLSATKPDASEEEIARLWQQARAYAHCNCPENPRTGVVDYHSNCAKRLMPILDKLEATIRAKAARLDKSMKGNGILEKKRRKNRAIVALRWWLSVEKRPAIF